MQIRQLQYFVAVAEQLNYRKAAESLYVTQPLLSKQIADLEAEVGYPLFVRNTRSVTLTPAGEVMLEKANQLLRQSDSLLYSVRKAAQYGDSYGILRIGYEESFAQSTLGQLLNQMSEKYPGIELNLQCLSSTRINSALQNDMIDIGFVLLPDKHQHHNIKHRILCTDTLCLVASARLTSGKNSLEELINLSNKYPICLLEKNAKGLNHISNLCRQMDVYTNFIFVKTIQDMLLYAESGCGICVIPRSYLAYTNHKLLTICDITSPDADLCMVAIWNKDSLCVPRERFLEICPSTQSNCQNCSNNWCWAKQNIEK